MLEIDKLSIRYDNAAAVEDFSLTLGADEIVTLVGPTGCGKTSVLRAVAGLVAPSAGEIRIGAHRIDAKHRIGSPGCLHFEKARKVVCGSEQRRCREGSIPAEGFRTAIATEILCDAKFQCLFVIEGGPSHAERMKHAVAHEILKALA